MEKNFIKNRLRENIFDRIKEASKKPSEDSGDGDSSDFGEDDKRTYEDLNDKEKQKVQTLTIEVRKATQGPNKILKLSQVVQAAGLGGADDATVRSLFSKKVSGKPDAEGNIHYLTPSEAARLVRVVNNPNAYIKAS